MSRIDQAETVRVDLGARSYDIVVGRGLIGRAGQFAAPLLSQKRVIIVTDDNVARHHLDALDQAFVQAGIATQRIVLPDELRGTALREVVTGVLHAPGTELHTKSLLASLPVALVHPA